MVIDRSELERQVDAALATKKARLGFALIFLGIFSAGSFAAGAYSIRSYCDSSLKGELRGTNARLMELLAHCKGKPLKSIMATMDYEIGKHSKDWDGFDFIRSIRYGTLQMAMNGCSLPVISSR